MKNISINREADSTTNSTPVTGSPFNGSKNMYVPVFAWLLQNPQNILYYNGTCVKEIHSLKALQSVSSGAESAALKARFKMRKKLFIWGKSLESSIDILTCVHSFNPTDFQCITLGRAIQGSALLTSQSYKKSTYRIANIHPHIPAHLLLSLQKRKR